MRGEILREKLRKGERVYGTHVVSLGNPIAAKMTSELELDFVFICTEHMPVDRTEVSMMCQYYSARGISPIVRIPYPSAHWASMNIDCGAQGIVAPYVETKEQVKELVGAVKYRPIKGKFLSDILSGKRKPKDKLANFLKKFNADLYLIIGIESVEAYNALDELLSIEGLDGVFLGPHDMTCSMEIPEEYDNPEFTSLVVDVIKRCRKKGIGVGIHTDYNSEKNRRFSDEGANFIINTADIIKMRQKMSGDMKELRERFGDKYAGNLQ
jgi:2-keto-3-deoxy-L-rhamnonate aldolase RhmA